MNIGLWEVLLLLLVVAIIFGAGKLPHVMGDLAKGIRNFKTGLRDPGETEAGRAAPDSTVPPPAAVTPPEAPVPSPAPSPMPAEDRKPPTT